MSGSGCRAAVLDAFERLEKLGIGVLLVGEDGNVVETVLPAGAPVLVRPNGSAASSVDRPGAP